MGNKSLACPPGKYIDKNNNCVVCPDGTYNTTSNSRSCTQCPSGSIQEAGNRLNCMCPPGMSFNGKECVRCDDGSFSSRNTIITKAVTQCSKCPSGTVSNNDKSGCENMVKITAKKGYFIGKDGAQIPCPANMYQDVEAEQTWPESKYQDYLRLSDQEKIKGICRQCPQGATSAPGSADCVCPPGSKSVKNARNGGIMCVPDQEPICEPGFYVNNGNCTECPVGTYQYKKLPKTNTDGINACKKCPNNVPEGKEGATACFATGVMLVCPPGSRLGNGENCEECPAGMTSDGSVFFVDKSGKINTVKESQCRPDTGGVVKEGFILPDNKGGSIGIIIGAIILLILIFYMITRRKKFM